MRRKEKQVENLEEISAIIAKASICYLAMSVENKPYVVPLCFGYKDNILYFHSANEGKKLNMIQKNPNVSFTLVSDPNVIEAEKACNWSMSYKSIIGHGKAVQVEEMEEKIEALNIIMNQYATRSWEYPEKMLAKTCVVKVLVEEITGKQSLD